jgi:YggT family protein
MNLNPFINLINSMLSLYSFLLLAWMILGWLVRFEIVNPYQSIVKRLMGFGNDLFEPIFYQIRRVIPVIQGIDLSPIILLLLVNFLKEFLLTYLYTF